MPRTIIDIPDVQLGEIDDLCRHLGISRAEAVRRALQHYLQARTQSPADGFGLWRDDVPAAAAAPAAGPRRTRTRIRTRSR